MSNGSLKNASGVISRPELCKACASRGRERDRKCKDVGTLYSASGRTAPPAVPLLSFLAFFCVRVGCMGQLETRGTSWWSRRYKFLRTLLHIKDTRAPNSSDLVSQPSQCRFHFSAYNAVGSSHTRYRYKQGIDMYRQVATATNGVSTAEPRPEAT